MLLARANDCIEALFDDIHHAIGKIDIELDFRVLRHETVQRRHDQPGQLRRADPQPAARTADGIGQFGFRRFDLAQDAPAPLQEQGTFGRQRDAARAAVKEPHTQAILGARNALAYRRRRHAEQPSRFGKTAGLPHLHKHPNTTEPIHHYIPTLIKDKFVQYASYLSFIFRCSKMACKSWHCGEWLDYGYFCPIYSEPYPIFLIPVSPHTLLKSQNLPPTHLLLAPEPH